jgi:tetratricopeptide (TPR) repeat protein
LQGLGAALFRAGQLDEARKVLTNAAGAATPGTTSPAYSWYFLAMTHHRLGNPAEARSWYDKAVRHTEEVLAKDREEGSLPWNRRATLELLRDEAAALLGLPSPRGSPELLPAPITKWPPTK